MRRIGIALALACLPATMFLLQDGYFSSSDGMIHLYRVFELDRSLHAGILFPRWFPLSGYGYGLPVFNYYPPLAYYLAELFHLAGAGYIVSIKLLLALGFFVAAGSMFLFARDLIGNGAAFVAGVSFAYLPYLLSDAYVRGNFPEFLAMSLIPLALLAFRRVYERPETIQILGAAFALAAIVCAHHLTAMLFAVLLAGYIGWIFLLRRDARALLRCVGAGGLGLALSAFYWLPALTELNLVYVGPSSAARFIVTRLIEPAAFFAPSLAYTYLPQADALTHAPGFPQTILALLVGIIALISFSRITHHAHLHRTQVQVSRFTFHVLFFFLVVVISLAMTLTPASPLWYALSPLRFLQFPWRFHVLAGVGMAFLIGAGAKWILDRPRASALVVPGLSIALILLGVWNLPLRAFPLTDAQVDLTRSANNDYVVAQMGWGWTREFVPAAVTDSESIYAPLAKPGIPSGEIGSPKVEIIGDGLDGSTFHVSTPQSFELSLHTFYFPGWQAYIDYEQPIATYARSSLGLVTATVPPGDHYVSFYFGDTSLRRLVNIASIVTFIAVIVWLFVLRGRYALILVELILLLIFMLSWHNREGVSYNPPVAVSANLDQQAMLIGYATDRSDATMQVTLYWLALQDLNRDYTAFVQFIDSSGAVIAQNDGYPDQSLTPTTRWIPGEVIADRHNLPIQEIPSGDYHLTAGMYFVADQGLTSLGNPINLGAIKVAR